MSSENLREKIIELLHWKEYRFIGQGDAIFEGSLTQESEEQIADQILSHLKSQTITDWETGFTAFNEPFPFGKKSKL